MFLELLEVEEDAQIATLQAAKLEQVHTQTYNEDKNSNVKAYVEAIAEQEKRIAAERLNQLHTEHYKEDEIQNAASYEQDFVAQEKTRMQKMIAGIVKVVATIKAILNPFNWFRATRSAAEYIGKKYAEVSPAAKAHRQNMANLQEFRDKLKQKLDAEKAIQDIEAQQLEQFNTVNTVQATAAAVVFMYTASNDVRSLFEIARGGFNVADTIARISKLVV